MKVYSVETRFFSKQDTVLTRIHLFFKLHSNLEPSIKMIRQKETDLTAKTIVVQDLSWRTARELEKYIALQKVYIALQLTHRQLRFKFVIPLKPDQQPVLLGLNTWALSKSFVPSKSNFVSRNQSEWTVARLETKSDAEDLQNLLIPFSEETSFRVTYDFSFVFGVLATVSVLCFVLFVFSYISRPVFRFSLVFSPFILFSVVFTFAHFLFPPIFVSKKGTSKKEPGDC